MSDQKQKLIKGRVIIALHEVLQRKPTREEIERYSRAAQILYRVFSPPILMKTKSHSRGPMALM